MSIAATATGTAVSRAAHGHGETGRRAPDDRFQVGERLDLEILERLGGGRYRALLGGVEHIVESMRQLDAGSVVRTSVTGTGDRLELQYLDAAKKSQSAQAWRPVAASPVRAAPKDLVGALSAHYRVTLDQKSRDLLQSALARAAEPDKWVQSALYLQKLGQAIEPDALQALYRAQSSPATATAAPAIAMQAALVAPQDAQATQQLAQAMAAALPAATQAVPQSGADVSAQGGEQGSDMQDRHAALAATLLNLEDGGSQGYRFGSLPLIVGQQLMELDFALFQQRQPDPGKPAVRKMVMSLQTDSFGPVEVVAQAIDDHLSVRFSGASAALADHLSTYGDDVRALVEQLGWHVDAVSYTFDPQPARAAGHVVQHVLSAGTVDRVW